MARPRETKDRIFEQFARIGHAVASPKRLELLDLLCQSEKSVEILADQAAMSIANTSRHLQILRGARLVDARKDGLRVYYRLADEEVCRFFGSLRNLAAARLAEIDLLVRDYFDDPKRLEPVDKRKLLKQAKAGEIVILDVRPRDEYIAGHVPFARSVPLHELKTSIARLSKEKEIVAYCRGPYCVLAQEAVKIMRAKGFKAFRLEDGVTEWQESGMPVEK
ncbi:MAG: ArsR family transcriptional regulator [candidate division Zixibacteria bacterium RBG_16_53_22]|nr:MAG: ArsR family transcriptional regulator [candidate division Zixibacteria bacterium RBG_16_53_22]